MRAGFTTTKLSKLSKHIGELFPIWMLCFETVSVGCWYQFEIFTIIKNKGEIYLEENWNIIDGACVGKLHWRRNKECPFV